MTDQELYFECVKKAKKKMSDFYMNNSMEYNPEFDKAIKDLANEMFTNMILERDNGKRS